MPCSKKPRRYRISNRLLNLEKHTDKSFVEQLAQQREAGLELGSSSNSELYANGSTSIKLEENDENILRAKLSDLVCIEKALAEQRSEVQQVIGSEFPQMRGANGKVEAFNGKLADNEAAKVIADGTVAAERHQWGQFWPPIRPNMFHDTAYGSDYTQTSNWGWQRPPNFLVDTSELILRDEPRHAPPDFCAINTSAAKSQTSPVSTVQVNTVSARMTLCPPPGAPTTNATTPPLHQANDADPAKNHHGRRHSQDSSYCIDPQRKSRGRPKGSRNKEKDPNHRHQKIRRGPGRPRGSKNKPKMEDSVPIVENNRKLFEGGPPFGSNSKTNVEVLAPIVAWMPYQYEGDHQEQGEIMFALQNPAPPLMFDPWIETMDWRHFNAWEF